MAQPFTLRSFLARLPSDGSTNFVRVDNIPSPLSHLDICELFQVPPAKRDSFRWGYCCQIQRTDFVAELPSEDVARAAVARINKGFEYQERRLRASFAQGLPANDAVELQHMGAKQLASEPHLFYALPNQHEQEVKKRRIEAETKIAKLKAIAKPKEWWVDTR